MKYKRVVLKLSGEALKNKKEQTIIDSVLLNKVAEAIQLLTKAGIQVAVVIGAGNIFRGKLASEIGIEHSVADYMGMLGTIINSLALQSALENIGVECRVMSSIEVDAVCEKYIRRKAISHLEKGMVTIFAGGTGNPYFTTDTGAALRASEMQCDALLKATQVDGVYDADPKTNPKAQRFSAISYDEVIAKQLKVMDTTAVALARENNIPIIVFAQSGEQALADAVSGKGNFTIIKKEV